VRQRIVRDECAGQAGDDHDLLQAGHPPADACWSDFADVDRRQHAGRADADAAEEPREDEDRRRVGGPGAERTNEEQHCRNQHHAAASDPVGQPPGGERAERAAEQDRADVKPTAC
jgi:hypothetical protein